MERAADAYRTISEVAEELDLPQHVLRFWETRFAQIKPLKRGGGRRFYKPDDVELLRTIRHLLYGEGYTIRGVQRILKEQGVKAVVAMVRETIAAGPAVRKNALAHAADSAPTLDDGDEDDGDAFDAPIAAHDGLGAQDLARLRAALAEIAECSRILEAARG